MNLLSIVRVEAEEICEFAGRVNFGLETVLALGKHGCRVDLGAARPGDQVGGLQEHRRSMFPRQRRPSWTRRQGRIDGHLHMARISIAEVAENFPMLMRGGYGALVAGAHLVSTDVHGDLDGLLIVHLGIRLLQGFALWRTRRIAQHGLVDWVGDVESSVGHGV